jgi:hypothetical protein
MRCACCGRTAIWRVRNAFQSKANGKGVCASNVCWGMVTGGYPAEGKAI